MNRALFPLVLLALSSAALADGHFWDAWAVIKDGHIYTAHAPKNPEGIGRIFFMWQANCIKTANEIGGECVQVPDEPAFGTPERKAWQKKWCVPGTFASQACIY